MCDDTLLEKMKQYQVSPGLLECNPGPDCWCAQISHRFPVIQTDDCMSPKELLELGGDDLSIKDKNYLNSLIHKELVL